MERSTGTHHSTIPGPAEAERRQRALQRGAVDRGAAGVGVVDDLVGLFGVVGKDVEAQRPLAVVDLVDGGVEGVVGYYGEDGACGGIVLAGS